MINHSYVPLFNGAVTLPSWIFEKEFPSSDSRISLIARSFDLMDKKVRKTGINLSYSMFCMVSALRKDRDKVLFKVTIGVMSDFLLLAEVMLYSL